MSEPATVNEAPWTIGRLLGWTTDFFRRHELDEPRLCAEILLAHALRSRRIELYTRFDFVPQAAELAAYRELVRQAAAQAPIAYLVGQKEFYSLTFEVTRDVLIPRPETECLVEHAVRICKSAGTQQPQIWDLGVGSGCVIVTILSQLKNAVGLGTDLSTAALAVARRNAEKHGVADRLTLVEADGLTLPRELVPADGFDLIVSNPPYISDAEMACLPSTVREHEPGIALAPGGDGLGFFRRIASDAGDKLSDAGHALVEIGAGQRERVSNLFEAAGGWRCLGAYRNPNDPHDRVLHFEKT